MLRSSSRAITLSFINDRLHITKRNNQTDSAMRRRKVLVATTALVVLLALAYNYIGRPTIFLDAYRKLPDAQAIPALRDVLQTRFPVGSNTEAAIAALVADGADCGPSGQPQRNAYLCEYKYAYWWIGSVVWMVVLDFDDRNTISKPIFVNRGIIAL